MSQTCPISLKRINANLLRVISVEVITLGLLLMVTQNIIFAFILLFDFTMRTVNLKKFSPLAYIAQAMINSFHIKTILCDEAPKRFALYVGVTIITLFTFLYLLKLNLLASVLVGILLICAFLEATFDYCIGCKAYHLLQYLHQRKKK